MAGELDEAAVAAAWDGNAPTWVAHVRAGYDRYRELFTWPAFVAFLRSSAPDLRGLDIIDLGCGEGENTRRLARLGARMTGIDLSPQMLAAARAAEQAERLGITYHLASFAQLAGIADASYDLAVSTMALMDGPDFVGAASEARRALKPGGRLLFSVLHPCFATAEMGWLRDEAGREVALKVGRYFSDRADVSRWRFTKAPETSGAELFVVPRFPYRLADYVNGLITAGLAIERMEEPRPTEELAAAHPWLRRWREHAALVLFVSAIRS